MKKATAIILMIMNVVPCFAQLKSDRIPGDTLSKDEFVALIKNNFSIVANNNSKTTVGNFASADIKDGNLTFNASKYFDTGGFLSLNASGGINDNIFSVFNESHLSSNVAAEAKFSFIYRKKNAITYYEGAALEMHQQLVNERQKIDIESRLRDYARKTDSLKFENQIRSLDSTIKAMTAKHDALDKIQLNSAEGLALMKDILAKENQRDSLQLELLKIKAQPTQNQMSIQNAKDKKNITEKILNDFEIKGIAYGWFSVAVGFQNNSFTKFDSHYTVLSDQLTKQNYTTFHASLEYNYYHWNHHSCPTFYFLMGASGFIKDNFDDLSKTELTDVMQFGDSLVQRSLTKKRTVYQGDYQKDLKGAKLYVDYYQFFFKNAAAIHVFPEGIYQEHKFPQYNVGIGMLYAFTNAKDKEGKNKLNVELYYKLMDVDNSQVSTVSTFKRNQIGLRLSVPITFFNL